jgi:hypothetical protein
MVLAMLHSSRLARSREVSGLGSVMPETINAVVNPLHPDTARWT